MNNPTTVVGELTQINGHVSGDEDITIIGRVDGTITITSTLFVEECGVVVATIEAGEVIISGTVVGNITATDAIRIQDGGKVVGDLCAPRIMLLEGASLRGHIDMGMATPSSSPAPSSDKRSDVSTPRLTSAPSGSTKPSGSTAVGTTDKYRPSRPSTPSGSAAPVAKDPPKRAFFAGATMRPSNPPSVSEIQKSAPPPAAVNRETAKETTTSVPAKSDMSPPPSRPVKQSPPSAHTPSNAPSSASSTEPVHRSKPPIPPTAAGKKTRSRRK